MSLAGNIVHHFVQWIGCPLCVASFNTGIFQDRLTQQLLNGEAHCVHRVNQQAIALQRVQRVGEIAGEQKTTCDLFYHIAVFRKLRQQLEGGQQAVERAGTKAGNKGTDAAMAAMEMANLLKKIG